MSATPLPLTRRSHPRAWLPVVAMALAVLAGCSSAPRGGGYYQNDGPGSRPASELDRVPDAVPRIEPLASGPNRPYAVRGRSYTPQTADRAYRQRGLASWYGRQFHGRPTASGEPYDMYAMTAAHPTLPIPSYVRVRHLGNGREVIVRVNDRGPFVSGRIIDLSYAAAHRLGYIAQGHAEVEIERITHEEIRAGRWQREAAPTPEPILVRTTPPPAASAGGYWVQLGAFRQRDGAESFMGQVGSQVEWLAPLLTIFTEASLHRLQAGPYASRTEASAAAQRIRDALQLVPTVVER
ncbi:septal ring lytic transglycosylase RlpA family protein [Caldimonas caldifontis]|uniref:Endolytic peptidoglycan transglycosylase RlpA n=1 Tax=Caldimonas caldifontis TaxID=1452508 RepID=A0A2S5SVI5_9BURK|nr:septal ring lytic transglycosylase RlpA family protein [Caldimonas caldifontis]PPE66765.1 septal ring lytic transglycosylase RlpA family lipoprotein [Caldimonas caldifontis]